jgi:hypothetical protein
MGGGLNGPDISFLLVRHPAVLAKLRDEIWSVTKGRRDFTRNEIRKMPYLKAVLDESKPLLLSLRDALLIICRWISTETVSTNSCECSICCENNFAAPRGRPRWQRTYSPSKRDGCGNKSLPHAQKKRALW